MGRSTACPRPGDAERHDGHPHAERHASPTRRNRLSRQELRPLSLGRPIGYKLPSSGHLRRGAQIEAGRIPTCGPCIARSVGTSLSLVLRGNCAESQPSPTNNIYFLNIFYFHPRSSASSADVPHFSYSRRGPLGRNDPSARPHQLGDFPESPQFLAGSADLSRYRRDKPPGAPNPSGSAQPAPAPDVANQVDGQRFRPNNT